MTIPRTLEPPGEAAAVAVTILDEVLALVRQRRGLDFSGYRRATLLRRLTNRLIAVRAPSGLRYLAALRDSPDEVDDLVATLTVKVSRFYRNAAVFDALGDALLADLRARFPGPPLRLWSAGCAQGEEAYTLAMVLGAIPGEVLATDIDEAALAIARAGRYAAAAFDELPAGLGHLVVKDADGGGWWIAEAPRRRVRFLRHDLASGEAPGTLPFHLVCCRNVLIYFDSDLQGRVLRVLVDRVAPGGLLCLGEAEWPGPALALEPVDRKLKIFRRPAAGAP
jgi:chemotaxis methyl-accepting protein methylase